MIAESSNKTLKEYCTSSITETFTCDWKYEDPYFKIPIPSGSMKDYSQTNHGMCGFLR